MVGQLEETRENKRMETTINISQSFVVKASDHNKATIAGVVHI